jgi:hypothetical protein
MRDRVVLVCGYAFPGGWVRMISPVIGRGSSSERNRGSAERLVM